jgi:hypothetical protein
MRHKEKTMETTFENARVGDRVWSVEYGWGGLNWRAWSTAPRRVNDES